MEIIMEAKNIERTYEFGNQSYNILKNINFKIYKGDFVSIMGESGSGKSTLLHLLGVLDVPTNGSIIISGEEISKLDDKKQSEIRRKKLGFVFQSYNLIPTLSVEENILLPLYIDKKNIRNHKKRVDTILEMVSMGHRRKQTPLELSGGEQQRVAIGRALINDPEVILLDEPVGNLDSKNGEMVMNLLREINRGRSKTIVQVTHSDEFSKYGNRLFYMKDGILDERCVKK